MQLRQHSGRIVGEVQSALAFINPSSAVEVSVDILVLYTLLHRVMEVVVLLWYFAARLCVMQLRQHSGRIIAEAQSALAFINPSSAVEVSVDIFVLYTV